MDTARAASGANGRPVVVVIGPSACGKSSLVRALHERNLIRVHPTWTTRPRRADEGEGSTEHRFVSDPSFDALDAQGFFIDTARPFGLPHRYGLPPVHASLAGPADVVMLRAPWVERFARLVERHVVYQIEDDAERALGRLLLRGSQPLEVAARIEEYAREIASGRRVADRVFANDGALSDLVEAVAVALRTDVEDTWSRHREVA
jgi:guanylate kinase